MHNTGFCTVYVIFTGLKLVSNSTIFEQKNNPKELWKFINSVLPSKRSSSSPSVISVNNRNIYRWPSGNLSTV